MLEVAQGIFIEDTEVEISAIRAQGAGGQNVNKTSSAIHLRFDIMASTLPEPYKQGLLSSADSRINKSGVLVIKAQQYRTQEQNKGDALERLSLLITQAGVVKKPRQPTRTTLGAKLRRLNTKVQRGRVKALRTKSFIE